MSQEEAILKLKNGLSQFAGPYGSISINGVDVQGRLSEHLLKPHIQPLLEARTVDQLVSSFASVHASLLDLDIFENVAISMNPNKIVEIKLFPKKKHALKFGSNFSHHEGSGYISGSLCNKTGWGEHISLDISSGTRTKQSHMLRAIVPVPYAPLVNWKAEFLGYNSNKIVEWSGCKAYINGISARLSKSSGVCFGVDAVLRTLKSERLFSSPTIRNVAGDSFKLSFFYNFIHDLRVFDPVLPETGRGHLFDFQSEVAVNPSTAPFFKISLKHQSAFQIWRNIVGSFNNRAGIIFSADKTKPTHILDRFNLGGPLDVRGFRMYHLGPHDGVDALGGEVLFASGLSVFTPISQNYPNLKIHNFLNMGYLGLLKDSSFRNILQPSISAGIGICYTSSAARFELNVNMPLVVRRAELCQKGLQFGIGIDFL